MNLQNALSLIQAGIRASPVLPVLHSLRVDGDAGERASATEKDCSSRFLVFLWIPSLATTFSKVYRPFQNRVHSVSYQNYASSEKFVGDGERQRAVSLR